MSSAATDHASAPGFLDDLPTFEPRSRASESAYLRRNDLHTADRYLALIPSMGGSRACARSVCASSPSSLFRPFGPSAETSHSTQAPLPLATLASAAAALTLEAPPVATTFSAAAMQASSFPINSQRSGERAALSRSQTAAGKIEDVSAASSAARMSAERTA